MLLIKPKMRIVVHFSDEKDPYKKHGDLFIEFPNYEQLITYEIDLYYLEILKRNYHYAYLAVSDINLLQSLKKEIRIFSSIAEIYNSHHNCDVISVILKRKPDHRKEYLQKEGALSNNKGKIQEFMVSYLSGIVGHNQDKLLLIDKD